LVQCKEKLLIFQTKKARILFCVKKIDFLLWKNITSNWKLHDQSIGNNIVRLPGAAPKHAWAATGSQPAKSGISSLASSHSGEQSHVNDNSTHLMVLFWQVNQPVGQNYKKYIYSIRLIPFLQGYQLVGQNYKKYIYSIKLILFWQVDQPVRQSYKNTFISLGSF
jgi:hypothetical protein